MTIREFYAAIDESCDEVLGRFGGSEAMLLRFLKKFTQDGTYLQLEEAMKKESWEEVFRAAHTLKGLAANFGFNKLFRLSSRIVEEYRANNNGAIAPLFQELKPVYAHITEQAALLV